jgi:hypothetical protein
MNIEIFEIDFGPDGDLYMVTKRGNQIMIPNGEMLFEKWADRHGLSHRETQPEYDPEDGSATSSWNIYDKSPDAMREFANAHKHLWMFDRDRGGDLYGDPAELLLCNPGQ